MKKRDRLISQNLYFAECIAKKYWSVRGLPTGEFDDIQQEAYKGLVEAAHSYQPQRNTKFQTFAYPFIKGRILDRARNLFVPNKRLKNLPTIVSQLPPQSTEDPIDVLENRIHAQQIFRVALRVLSGARRRVFFWIYSKGLTLAEVSRKFGMTKSWAGRLHTKALKQVQARLKRLNEFPSAA